MRRHDKGTFLEVICDMASYQQFDLSPIPQCDEEDYESREAQRTSHSMEPAPETQQGFCPGGGHIQLIAFKQSVRGVHHNKRKRNYGEEQKATQ